MEPFIIICIGIAVGIFIPLMWQIGLVVVAIIFLILSENKKTIDGIGAMIFFGIIVCFTIGMLIGDGLDYLNRNYIKVNSETNIVLSNLPTLTCKSGIDNYILTEYNSENQNIINIKTGQVFLKENCSLK